MSLTIDTVTSTIKNIESVGKFSVIYSNFIRVKEKSTVPSIRYTDILCSIERRINLVHINRSKNIVVNPLHLWSDRGSSYESVLIYGVYFRLLHKRGVVGRGTVGGQNRIDQLG